MQIWDISLSLEDLGEDFAEVPLLIRLVQVETVTHRLPTLSFAFKVGTPYFKG